MATIPNFYLEFDTTGAASSNLILNEAHTTNRADSVRLIMPRFGAFYSDTLIVYKVDEITQEKTLLQKGVHYVASEMLHKTTARVGKSICTVILIRSSVNGKGFQITYQALGGHDQVNRDLLLDTLNELLAGDSTIEWDDVPNKPKEFTPAPHLHDALDLYGLEYITGSLDGVKYAIETTDAAVHRELFTYIEKQRFDTEQAVDPIYDNIDTVTALTRSAEDTLSLVSQNIDDCEKTLSKLRDDVLDVREKSILFDHLYGNAKLANVANLLCKREFDKTGQVIDLPSLFSGLVLHIDADDYSEVNRTWKNRVTDNVVFHDPANTTLTYGNSHTRPNLKAVKFTQGSYLQAINSVSLTAGTGKTIISVTGPIDEDARIKIRLMSGQDNRLEIDTAQGDAASYVGAEGTETMLLAKTSSRLKIEPFVVALNVANRRSETLCLCNVAHNGYKAPRNIEVYDGPIDIGSDGLIKLGDAAEEQSAELFTLMCWDRELSVTEMHAVLTYVRLKYNIDVNYLSNPNFSEDYRNFGSDLSYALDFTKRDCIHVTCRPIASLDSQNVYAEPVASENQYDYYRNDFYLFVLSKSANLSFWYQDVLLEPHARYVFKMSIKYGTVNPPRIQLRINSAEWYGDVPPLNDAQSVKEDITFTFTATQVSNRLELFNLNTSTNGNSFGVTKMSLVRLIYGNQV